MDIEHCRGENAICKGQGRKEHEMPKELIARTSH